MANKIFSTADAAITAADSNMFHLGCPIEVESGWILQIICPNNGSFQALDYPVDIATGVIGAQTVTAIAGISPENSGKILTKSVMFDATHMLTVFQDNTSNNINAIISEWDAVAHTLTSNTITDLGITGNGFGVNFEKIDSTHYLISYDSGTDLIQQVIEVNAGTYAVTTVGTPLTTGTTQAAPQSHVVQMDATHYSVSLTKRTAGTSGWFMIVEVNLGTWAVTTATALTNLGSGSTANSYLTTYYNDSLTWTFKISATKVVVFYNTGPYASLTSSCYRVIDINTSTWVITVGALQYFGGVTAKYMSAAYLTQADLTVAEAYFSGNVRSYKGQSTWKIGFDVAEDRVTVLSNAFNTWTNGGLLTNSPMGQVTELTGGDIIVLSYRIGGGGHAQLHSIFNADAPATSGALDSAASGATPSYGNVAYFQDVVALDSTHFVVLGSTTVQDFITYEVDAAGQIELLDYSFASTFFGSVSGVKLDSTHLLLSKDQYAYRVAEVDVNYVGSWSAVQKNLSAGGNDSTCGVKMYIAGEDGSYWYVIVNRHSTGTVTAVSVVSVDKATYVVAQVGSDLIGMGLTKGYDMTPVEGYTDKWVCIYTDTNLKAIVVGVDGSFEPVLEGAELDLGFVGTNANIQSVDATHFIITYSDASSDGWAETLEVNVGTWALSVASAAAYEFETSYLGTRQSRLVKVDSEHAALVWGGSTSTDYVNNEVNGVLGVLEMDAATYNITTSQKIKLISTTAYYSSLGLLDSDTLISVTSTDNNGGTTTSNNVQLWDVVTAGATQVTITGAGADFVAGSSTTLEVEVQDGAGVVDAADNTTRITFTPASQGQITGTVTGTNISGTGAVGNPRVVEVVAGVAKVTVENTTAETFTIAITNDGGLADPADDSIIVSAAAASAVALTTPAPDFIASATSNQTIQIQDTYGNLVTTDSTTRITYSPTLSGAATAVVVGTNISGTGLPGDPRVVEVANGVSTITLADTVAETFEVAFANDGGFSTPANDSIIVSAAAATKVSLTGAGSDFTVGGSTTVSVQIQDTYNNLIITDSTTRVTLTPTLAGQISGVTVGVNISGTGAAGAPRVVEVAGGIAAVTVTNLVIQTFEIAFINDGGYSNPANDSIDSLAAVVDGPGVMVGFNF